jgi:hypothetical protein
VRFRAAKTTITLNYYDDTVKDILYKVAIEAVQGSDITIVKLNLILGK